MPVNEPDTPPTPRSALVPSTGLIGVDAASTGPSVGTPLLRLDGVTKSFGKVQALRGVSFDLMPGEVHALLGENGAGKSTLVKIISGVHAPDEGRLEVYGQGTVFRSPADAQAAGIAMVYQELSLVPTMSVAANLFLGREPSRGGIVKQGEILERTRALVDEWGFPLDGKAIVGSLPFSHRQMTEILKGLMLDARILVLDEPTSAMMTGEEEVLFEAVRRVTERSVGVIYVTHRLREVFRLSQRVTVLRDGLNAGTHETSKMDMKGLIAEIVGPGNKAVRQATTMGLGPRGEQAASPEDLELTDDEAARARAGRYKVGVVLHTADSDWSKEQVRGITDTLAKYDAEVVGITDADFKVDRQIADLEAMVQRRPDAIISIPVNEIATAEAYAKVSRAGIQLIVMDNPPKGLEAGKDYASVVSADNYGNGQIAAEQLAEHVRQDGTVGILDFGIVWFSTNQRAARFRQWFADNRPDVILKQADFLDPADAERVTADFLDANPDVDGLFVVWDDPAMGAVRAVRAHGRHIPITTADLGDEVAGELARGDLVKGVGAQQPYDQGVAEAHAALKALLGEQTPPWVVLPGVPVTQRNLLEAYEQVWHATPPDELVEAARQAAATDGGHPAPAPPSASTDGGERVPVLELDGVSNERLRSVDLTVAPGEIVGLAGLVGSGRTEILETIFGLRGVTRGQMRVAGRPAHLKSPSDAIKMGIALVPEDRHEQGLVMDHSLERNIAMPRMGWLTRFGLFQFGSSRSRSREAIKELSIKVLDPEATVSNLSGGNQQKVVLGKWRGPRPDLLLLDEPTVGVDVGAREEIYQIMKRTAAEGAAVLVASSDLVELLIVCDRIAIVVDGRIVSVVSGDEIGTEDDLHHLVQNTSQSLAQEGSAA